MSFGPLTGNVAQIRSSSTQLRKKALGTRAAAFFAGRFLPLSLLVFLYHMTGELFQQQPSEQRPKGHCYLAFLPSGRLCGTSGVGGQEAAAMAGASYILSRVARALETFS
jgi:hypothetical protein